MNLDSSVELLKGVGPKTAELLYKVGLKTVRDLVYFFPRAYESFENPTRISDIKPGKITIKGRLAQIKTTYKRHHLNLTEATIQDDSGALRVIWFNQPYRAKQFDPDKEYYFSGLFEFNRGRYQLSNPTAILVKDYDDAPDKFQPIYPKKGELKSLTFKKIIANLRPFFASIENILPDNASNRSDALFKAHFPNNEQEVKESKEYLALEELFCFILAAKLNKLENSKLKSDKIPQNLEIIKEFIAQLPFTPTNAQKKAVWEIIQDLERETPMNRLLEGDVGSGKTLVATLASLVVAVSHKESQIALLAPTEVLATQHAETFANFLKPFNIDIALLTGSTKNKKALKEKIKSGEVKIIIGTHAILTDDTEFKKLNLVIIDEQHRFGVAQRQKLLLKTADKMPHLLSMTATPIPRSLQLTLFGDLDISILNEIPKNRIKIQTEVLDPLHLESVYEKINTELDKKHQIYYICKAIEDNEESSLKNVEKEFRKISQKFKKHTVKMLHGKMKPTDKNQIMADFKDQKIDILVSTTVVEVGVDNPNATIIVIENADQYGLAALHQLRGRVGRGSFESFCYLVTSDNDKAPSRRLNELEKSSDGFYLSNVDLELRGPGEIYGSLQHGILDLKVASLSDTKAIKCASDLVSKFLEAGKPPAGELAKEVSKYQKLTTLN